jgi:hypothetical protein
MMTRTGLLVALLATLAVVSCTDDPTVPSPLPPPGGNPGETGTLSGTVVGHLDPSPVSGATVLHGTSAAVTAADGTFTLNGVATSGAVGVVVNAPGHVYRRAVFDMTPNRAGVKIDVIREAPPFDLLFYRAWVRDIIESQSMQSTRPWTVDPSFYFKTLLNDTETIVPDETIDRLVGIFANSVVELSGGKRRIDRVERGTSAREPLDGWVNVTFALNLNGALGRSSVGGNSATMALVYAPLLQSTPQNNPYNCELYLYSIADHEITHTMGFFHTFDVVGDSFSGPGCTGTGRPERTRIHSAIMYARPFGNTDPDIDPASSAQLVASESGYRPVVECFRQ